MLFGQIFLEIKTNIVFKSDKYIFLAGELISFPPNWNSLFCLCTNTRASLTFLYFEIETIIFWNADKYILQFGQNIFCWLLNRSVPSKLAKFFLQIKTNVFWNSVKYILLAAEPTSSLQIRICSLAFAPTPEPARQHCRLPIYE